LIPDAVTRRCVLGKDT